MKVELTDQLNLFGPAMTENPSLLSASVSDKVMKSNIRKSLLICPLLSLAGGFTSSTYAADAPPVPAPTTASKPTTQQLSGKVIAVDKIAKTVSLQIGTQTYTLQFTDKTKIAQDGKEKKIDAVTIGDDISVTVAVRELAGGKVEVVVTSVDLPTTTAAQGGKGKGHGRSGGSQHPFQNGPNPANFDGPIISPHSKGK